MKFIKYKHWKAIAQKAAALLLSASFLVSSPLCAYADQGPGVSAEYSGRFYTPIPEIGNHRSDMKETAIPF